MKRSALLNGVSVEYELTVKKVKNINLRIRSDGSVCVSANKLVPIHVIENFMLSRADFILSALERFESRRSSAPKDPEYADGETVTILGKSLTLRVNEGKSNEVCPFFDEGYIALSVKDESDAELRKRVYERWRKQIFKEIIVELCRKTYTDNPVFARKGIAFPALHFKTMRTRWGSCNSSGGSLNFNYSLIEAPIECIEYVVMHEFVHFLHPNHSKEFYNTLTALMSDWKARKEILNGRRS